MQEAGDDGDRETLLPTSTGCGTRTRSGPLKSWEKPWFSSAEPESVSKTSFEDENQMSQRNAIASTHSVMWILFWEGRWITISQVMDLPRAATVLATWMHGSKPEDPRFIPVSKAVAQRNLENRAQAAQNSRLEKVKSLSLSRRGSPPNPSELDESGAQDTPQQDQNPGSGNNNNNSNNYADSNNNNTDDNNNNTEVDDNNTVDSNNNTVDSNDNTGNIDNSKAADNHTDADNSLTGFMTPTPRQIASWKPGVAQRKAASWVCPLVNPGRSLSRPDATNSPSRWQN